MSAYKKQLLAAAYAEEWISGYPNSENCSGFLKSAARALGVEMPNGNADAIIAELDRLSNTRTGVWRSLGTGHVGLQAAVREAAAGRFVIAGMTSRDYGQRNGHVAIVLPELEGPHKAPLVFGGGSDAARSPGTRTIRDVWAPSKHQHLRFFLHATALLASATAMTEEQGTARHARRLEALSFYRRLCPESVSEVNYIDLHYPVRVVRIPKGTKLWGHKDPRVSPLRTSFFAIPGTPSDILGVHAQGNLKTNPGLRDKVLNEYEVLVDIPMALESVCANGDDVWSVQNAEFPVNGGGWQYKVPRAELYVRYVTPFPKR